MENWLGIYTVQCFLSMVHVNLDLDNYNDT